MPVANLSAPGPSTLIKMEDRKRPVSGSDDIAPPSKRHQSVNGGSKSKDDDTKDDAWVEEFQKDAIYRQMLEYKREKTSLEARINELEKSSIYHDDHLRMIDAWWLQLVQEVALLAGEQIPFQPDPEASSASPYLSPLDFKDRQSFQDHLTTKEHAIKSSLQGLFTRLASVRGQIKPDITELEGKVNSLLAAQKEFMVKLDRYSSEKEQLSQELNTATLRYFKAEKKLDRAKSAQVQKLEQQALAHATSRPAGINGVDTTEPSATDQETRLAFQEVKALAEKQTEQLESYQSENKSLREEVTNLQARLTGLSDEDYAKTDVFKQFKSQNDDLIKRVNNLEATNKQLRDEADRLKSERTAFQRQLETEAQTLTNEYEEQIRTRDTDLSRIRSARDDLYAELQLRKQRDEQDRIALAQLKELAEAKQDRIAALEAQLETVRPGEDSPSTGSSSDLTGMTMDELRERLLKREEEYRIAMSELQPMEQAYKKTWALAHKKVLDFTAMEDKLAAAKEDKTKADHRYFAARKDMDVKQQELKALRVQNAKSSEIISQLKEVEASNKVLVQNLEKQLHDLKGANSAVMSETKKMEATSSEAVRKSESYKSQLGELGTLLRTKDSTLAEVKQRVTTLEAELEKLRARIDHIQKDRDSWKAKCLGNSSDEEQMLRQFALCTICRSNFKDVVLKTCGHVFCKECVEARIANRMRKCPNCSKPFDKLDALTCHF